MGALKGKWVGRCHLKSKKKKKEREIIGHPPRRSKECDLSQLSCVKAFHILTQPHLPNRSPWEGHDGQIRLEHLADGAIRQNTASPPPLTSLRSYNGAEKDFLERDRAETVFFIPFCKTFKGLQT